MRNFRRRASLAAAIGIITSSLATIPAQASTRPAPAPGTVSGRTAAAVATIARTAPAVSTGAAAVRPPVATGVSEPAEPVCVAPYINEDPRLGPKNLPKKGVLGRILRDYVPLGGLSPQKFLDRYWDWARSSYRFPPDFGFAHSGGYSNGRMLTAAKTLRVGERVDRFGGEGGSFLAPYGTPFSERGIPPTNLDTFPGAPQYPCNYRVYRVSKEFAVEFGPIASAFQQPGGGSQYHLVSRYITEAPQARDEVPVSWLVEKGYLQRIN